MSPPALPPAPLGRSLSYYFTRLRASGCPRSEELRCLTSWVKHNHIEVYPPWPRSWAFELSPDDKLLVVSPDGTCDARQVFLVEHLLKPVPIPPDTMFALSRGDGPAASLPEESAPKEEPSGAAAWIAAEAKRMKTAGEIPPDIRITNFARELEGRMKKAAEKNRSLRPVKWPYIKNNLRAWSLWPVSHIR
jgi:hypothetical protein